MNDSDWGLLEQLLAEGWSAPNAWTERKAAAYRLVLDPYDRDAVATALRRRMESGGPWRPSIAEVVAAIATDPTVPTWSEAYQAIFGPRGVTRAPDEQAALDRAGQVHELLQLFVRAKGWDWLRLLPVNDPEFGHVRQRELCADWERHVERAEERQREGRTLQALGRGSRAELTRLDPLAALEGPRPAITERSVA